MASTRNADDTTSAALVASLGPGQVRPGSRGEAVDGVQPHLVITARTAANVSTVVNEARANRLAIIPCGGGTQLDRGNPPRCFDIRLSLTGLASIIERHGEDMTVTAEAGVTLAQLNRALASRDQRFAVDAASPQQATLGGIVAANSGGGLAHSFGAPRDLVLGMRVIDGRGRSLVLGGRVVKNVAGYDLPRLFTGSWGTLGVITEVTLRTHPLAPQATTMRLSFEDPASLEHARVALFASALPLAAMDFSTGTASSSWTLQLRIEGTSSEVDYQIDRVRSLCASPDERLENQWLSSVHANTTSDLVVIGVTRPKQCVEIAEQMFAAARKHTSNVSVSAHAGLGPVYLGCSTQGPEQEIAIVTDLRTVTGACRARLLVSRCCAQVKPALDVWGQRPESFSLMANVKQRFDPDGILCPGRFVGRM
ncbi:MAG: FAD-binding oxidoreductase [Candidatus Binatia bacterium]